MKIEKIIFALLSLGLAAGGAYWLYKKQILKPSIFQCVSKSKSDCLTCCEKTFTKDQPVELSNCVNECMDDISTTMGD